MSEMSNGSQLYEAMAGNGNPRRALTPLRKQMLRALHDEPSLSHLARVFHLSAAELQLELAPLVEAQLLQTDNDSYHPAFLIADRLETQRITDHAARLARDLAAYLLRHWEAIIAAACTLTAIQCDNFASPAFFLVGDKLLDVGLLDALARDGTLMSPAPARPTPADPTARYYFWMIEGNADQLGKYGQRATPLPLPNWYLLTFGQYRINGHINAERESLEANAKTILENQPMVSPFELAECLGIPAFTQAESAYWTTTTQKHADDLARIYRTHETELRQLYAGLRASAYMPQGFGEFFCWYDHVVYACTIDMLADAGVMQMPERRFTAAIWHEEPQQKDF